MTYKEAIRILHPNTTKEELRKIEHLAGFRGKEATIYAVEEACLVACDAMNTLIEIQEDNHSRFIQKLKEEILPEILEKIHSRGVTAPLEDYRIACTRWNAYKEAIKEMYGLDYDYVCVDGYCGFREENNLDDWLLKIPCE
jgi:PP-loop superfamily ATP-utilizing enzyme